MHPEAPTDRHPEGKVTQNHAISQCGTVVKIMGLHVCGLRSKSQLGILEKYVQEFDVVCLSETKTYWKNTLRSVMLFVLAKLKHTGEIRSGV